MSGDQKIVITEYRRERSRRDLTPRAVFYAEMTKFLAGSSVHHIEIVTHRGTSFSIFNNGEVFASDRKSYTVEYGYRSWAFYVPYDRALALHQFLKKKIGKKFNHYGLVANFISFLPESLKRKTDGEVYFCSELVCDALLSSKILEPEIEIGSDSFKIEPHKARPCDIRKYIKLAGYTLLPEAQYVKTKKSKRESHKRNGASSSTQSSSSSDDSEYSGWCCTESVFSALLCIMGWNSNQVDEEESIGFDSSSSDESDTETTPMVKHRRKK